MNVYIKTFNRPFYLDRCIRSIQFNVKNYDAIIVLDDGTLGKYKEKIRPRHPDVQWTCSQADDHKYALLKQGRFDEIRKRYQDPAAFWTQAIGQDPNEYCLILEDDTWFVAMADLAAIEDSLRKNHAALLKLFWGEDRASGAGEVYRREPISESLSLDYFAPTIRTLDDVWKIWLQCMAIYRKTYWLNSYAGIQDGVNDENHQLKQAVQYVQSAKPPCSFAKTHDRAVYQGWAAPGRSDPKYYNLGLAQHAFLDALNEAWYRDQLDVTEAYPFDFSPNYLTEHFRQTVSAEQVTLWQAWRQGDLGPGYTLYYNE